MGNEQHRMYLKGLRLFFDQPSYVNHPILIGFGLVANIGLKRTLNEFEMTMAILLTDWTNQSKPTNSKHFYFHCFQYNLDQIWYVDSLCSCRTLASSLLLPCSWPASSLLLAWQRAVQNVLSTHEQGVG